MATAEIGDAEMARRIDHHKARRPAGWGLVEAPLQLAAALRANAAEGTMPCGRLPDPVALQPAFAGARGAAGRGRRAIDCPLLDGETMALLDTLPTLPGQIILVSNEVGCGIVPMQALSRYSPMPRGASTSAWRRFASG